ncbi:MAG: Flp pilus assembly protein CpaB [Phycisphaeraceae bacterium]
MKGTILGLMALGLIAAVSAMLLVSAMMAQEGTAAPGEAEVVAESDVEVVVARSSLNALHQVTQDDVVVERVSKSEAPEGAMGPSWVIGRTISLPMAEGQTFTRRSFTGEGPGAHLAAALPDGKRAVSVPLDTYSGMEGLLYPGSVVDVVASLGSRAATAGSGAASITLLESVQVLGVHDRTIVNSNDEDEEEASDTSSTGDRRNSQSRVTLMVDSDQLRALQLAMEHGNVTLALRNPSDRLGAEGVTFLSELTHEGRPRPSDEQLAEMLRRSQDETMEAVAAMLNRQPSTKNPEATSESPQEQEARGWDVDVLRGGKLETRRLVQQP